MLLRSPSKWKLRTQKWAYIINFQVMDATDNQKQQPGLYLNWFATVACTNHNSAKTSQLMDPNKWNVHFENWAGMLPESLIKQTFDTALPPYIAANYSFRFLWMTDFMLRTSFLPPPQYIPIPALFAFVDTYPVVLFWGCKGLWETETAVSTPFSIKLEAGPSSVA